jgi:hypothetical protein
MYACVCKCVNVCVGISNMVCVYVCVQAVVSILNLLPGIKPLPGEVKDQDP